MRKSKNNKKSTLIAVFAGVISTVAVSSIITAYKRYSKDKRDREIKELVYDIEMTLSDFDVVDFDSFNEHLKEYFNVKAEKMDTESFNENENIEKCNFYEVIYSSPKFSSKISSSEIFVSCIAEDEKSYNYEDLKEAFEKNKRFEKLYK